MLGAGPTAGAGRGAFRRRGGFSRLRRGAALGPAGQIQAIAQLFTGLEEWDDLLIDRHGFAGARVAAFAGLALLYRKGPEAAKLDTITLCQCVGDLFEDRGDDPLHIPMIEMRI